MFLCSLHYFYQPISSTFYIFLKNGEYSAIYFRVVMVYFITYTFKHIIDFIFRVGGDRRFRVVVGLTTKSIFALVTRDYMVTKKVKICDVNSTKYLFGNYLFW